MLFRSPTADALTLDGLNVSRETIGELLRINPADWEPELADITRFFEKFGKRLPEALLEEQQKLGTRFQRAVTA